MASNARHVALIGFMASGKSTIGERLARKLGRRFVDVDEEIVREHGAISKIFAREGEPTFRRYERAAIAGALACTMPSVIAVGGGAPWYAPTRELLARRSYRVFLLVPLERIERRLRRAKGVRPVLGRRPRRASIVDLYSRRLPFYREAELILDCSRLSERGICDAIVAHLAATGGA